MADYPEAVYWLTLINDSGLKLNLVKPIIQRWCLAEQRSLSDLFELSPLEWSTTFGLTGAEGEQATTARDKVAQQAKRLAGWQAQGLELLIRTDPRFPQRLIRAMPPAQQPLLLWARGALDLLNNPTVAMLGSETPNPATAGFLGELMQALVNQEIGLVSGYGRGLDRSSFELMLKTRGGRAVVVLPMGLAAFAQTTSKLESAVQAGQIVLVSPFAPSTPYQEKLAEARNLLIDYLALALLVIETDEEATGRAGAALDRGQPVFVSLTDTASNRALIDQGALLLTDAGEVVEMVQQAVIDAALQEPTGEEAPLAAQAGPAGPPPLSNDPDEDYSLRLEEVEPIDSEEALEILSLGGEVPEILRRRLKNSGKEQEK